DRRNIASVDAATASWVLANRGRPVELPFRSKIAERGDLRQPGVPMVVRELEQDCRTDRRRIADRDIHHPQRSGHGMKVVGLHADAFPAAAGNRTPSRIALIGLTYDAITPGGLAFL